MAKKTTPVLSVEDKALIVYALEMLEVECKQAASDDGPRSGLASMRGDCLRLIGVLTKKWGE